MANEGYEIVIPRELIIPSVKNPTSGAETMGTMSGAICMSGGVLFYRADGDWKEIQVV